MPLARVILDVDPGVDDALAILLAVASPEIEVLGVTVVSGNVPVETGTQNALDVLAFVGASHIPVYRGAGRPLVREPVHTREVHGHRGLGSAILPSASVEAREGAIEFLSEGSADTTLVAVGPLTNLALAERAHPGTLRKAKEVVVMGGAVLVPGNSSPTAEYNFFADPQAAKEVLASGANLTLVPLDVTHQVRMTEEDIGQLVGQGATDRVRFFEEASRVVVEHGRSTGGFVGIHLHDPVAVGWTLEPDLFGTESFWLDVEVDGTLTAGQVVVDRRRVEDEKRVGRPVRCIVQADVSGFLSLFVERALRCH